MRTWARRAMEAGLVATSLLVSAPTAAAADPGSNHCRPAVVVAGDPALSDDLALLLSARGVATQQSPGCPHLVAELTQGEAALQLTLRDPADPADAEFATRRVSSPETAAAYVESWARPDLAGPLLHGIDPSPPSSETTAAVRSRPAISVAFRPGLAVGQDRTLWVDLSLGACVHADPFCIGLRLRGSEDLGGHGRSSTLDTDRSGIDVLLSTEVPIAVGKLALSPGVAIGVGWLRSLTDRGKLTTVERAGLRMEAFTRLLIPLGRGFDLDTTLAFSMAPRAGTDQIEHNGSTLAGTPEFQIQLGLGVRYGLR